MEHELAQRIRDRIAHALASTDARLHVVGVPRSLEADATGRRLVAFELAVAGVSRAVVQAASMHVPGIVWTRSTGAQLRRVTVAFQPAAVDAR